jgi:hypothetical protein
MRSQSVGSILRIFQKMQYLRCYKISIAPKSLSAFFYCSVYRLISTAVTVEDFFLQRRSALMQHTVNSSWVRATKITFTFFVGMPMRLLFYSFSSAGNQCRFYFLNQSFLLLFFVQKVKILFWKPFKFFNSSAFNFL